MLFPNRSLSRKIKLQSPYYIKYCKINPINSKTSKNFLNAEHFQFSFPYLRGSDSELFIFKNLGMQCT